jgi:hypothetical protein
MDERTVSNFEVGQLIKWYDLCADNIVVFDSGVGVIVEKYTHMNCYKIYRNAKEDYQDYNGYFLEKVK